MFKVDTDVSNAPTDNMTKEEQTQMGYDLFIDAIAEFPFKNLWDFKETVSAAAKKLGKSDDEITEFLGTFFDDFVKRKPLLRDPKKNGKTTITGFASFSDRIQKDSHE